MNKPIRIQRKRTKGWKMPPNTVYVGRPTKWGNPYQIGILSEDYKYPVTLKQCIGFYSRMLFPFNYKDRTGSVSDFLLSENNMEEIKYELRGKNVCCWCPLDQLCHADVLLRVANG